MSKRFSRNYAIVTGCNIFGGRQKVKGYSAQKSDNFFGSAKNYVNQAAPGDNSSTVHGTSLPVP